MEKKLKKLFDYQRFEQNDKLEKLIRETESRYAKGLSDDDLFLVNAAGEPKIDADFSDWNMPNGTQVYTSGGLTGSLIDSGGGGGGGGTGGSGTAM